jgi:SAM-dependent methyltransferase
MTQTNETIPVKNLPWFKVWFDSPYYHKLYINRSDGEAADFIDELVAALHPKADAVMLDVGCGNGRHCKRLAAKGFYVTGIDLALSSIRQAKKYETGKLHFFQHDMRKPVAKGYFDYVFNFFTSFGYFKNEDEHRRVLQNMCAALKANGALVMDYMNVHYTERHLVPKEEKEIDGTIFHITRWMDEKYFFKKIVIDDQAEPIEYTEQVARFTLNDFRELFSLHNLQIEKVYGDYALNEFDENNSSRLVMIIKKS